MKATLCAGLASVDRVTIDRERTIGFMGEAARVYATPMLVRDIEVAHREHRMIDALEAFSHFSFPMSLSL